MNQINKTILLVEDEQINATLGRRTLEKYGFNVVHANTGEKAIDMVDSIPAINLILMDIDLGDGIDGTDAADKILKVHDLPLVFLSSHTERDIVEKTEKITSYGYIVKNSGETVLIASIKMAFRLFEAKKMEEVKEYKLRESEQHYRTLFENTGSGIIVIESDTYISLANEKFASSLGYSRDEIENRMKWTDMVCEDDLDFMLKQHHLRRDNPECAKSSYEFRFKTKDGELRNNLLFISMIPGTRKSIGSLIDITDQKIAENALKDNNEQLSAMNEEFEAANEELIETNKLLEEKEEEYRLLFENSTSGIFIIEDGRLKMFNEAVCVITGRSSDELKSVHFLNFIYPCDSEKIWIHFNKISKGIKSEISDPVRIITTDNKIRWIGIKSEHVMWKGKNATLNFINDITERKTAEDELLISESKYRKIFENVQDVFYQTDLSGKIIEISPSIETYSGFTPAELIGTPVQNVYCNPDNRGELINTIMIGGKVVDYELNLKSKDNRNIITSASTHALFDSAGKPIGVEGSLRDITHRKQIENQLANKLVFQQTLIDSIPYPVFTKDASGRFVGCNRSYEVEFGTTRDYLIGKTVLDLDYIPMDERIRFHVEDMNVISQAGRKSYEMPIVYADGITHITLYSVDGFKLADGRPGGLIGMLVDITERKKAEDKIIQINKARSMYLARMSHEIRTPLNSIMGLIDLTLMTDDESEKKEYLGIVKESSLHLISIINDVLDYSKIESGALTLESVLFDPVKEIRTAISLFNHICSAKDLCLNFDLNKAAGKYHVEGDPARFRQVIINILGNAVKFTNKGGVEINAEWLMSLISGDSLSVPHLSISIKDTGPGISPVMIGTIFDNFTQSGPDISGRYGGTGLGLAISKELVEMMGGAISVESELDKGTIFTLNIPFKNFEVNNNNKIKSLSGSPVSCQNRKEIKYSILVAEDNPVSVKLLKALLVRNGHSIVTAANGLSAIELLSENDFDAVLMDVEMPVMDGLEATRRIRSGASGVEKTCIPIVALTAYDSSDIKLECIKAGMNCFLSKPVKVEEFNLIIPELIEAGIASAKEFLN